MRQLKSWNFLSVAVIQVTPRDFAKRLGLAPGGGGDGGFGGSGDEGGGLSLLAAVDAEVRTLEISATSTRKRGGQHQKQLLVFNSGLDNNVSWHESERHQEHNGLDRSKVFCGLWLSRGHGLVQLFLKKKSEKPIDYARMDDSEASNEKSKLSRPAVLFRLTVPLRALPIVTMFIAVLQDLSLSSLTLPRSYGGILGVTCTLNLVAFLLAEIFRPKESTTPPLASYKSV
ncbi:hypothetical protein HDU96_000488 [Phlyctochytrium bullatum]|nr:hypothetical protein HDU96_000488 [Phlyctochytrium bullatum]